MMRPVRQQRKRKRGKCVWTFRTTKHLPNGASYKMTLTNRPHMIQQNGVNSKGGYCALKWDE
jgi:hypothetical protein